MERWTSRDASGCYHLKRIHGYDPKKADLVQRVGAYEDSGFEPPEIKSLYGEWTVNKSALDSCRKQLDDLMTKYGLYHDGMGDAILNLLQAQKEGRLIVVEKEAHQPGFVKDDALAMFEHWNNSTGAIPAGHSWYYELTSIIESVVAMAFGAGIFYQIDHEAPEVVLAVAKEPEVPVSKPEPPTPVPEPVEPPAVPKPKPAPAPAPKPKPIQPSARSSAPVEEIRPWKGFVHVRCEHCKKEITTCLRQPTLRFNCKECGRTMDLPAATSAFIECECGFHGRYLTNMADWNFDIPCVSCQCPNTVSYNPGKNNYIPIGHVAARRAKPRKK